MAFDSLGYVRRLEQSGVDRVIAEAHADAARDFVLRGVASAEDVHAVSVDIERATEQLKHELVSVEQRMTIKLGGLLVVAVGAVTVLDRILA